MQPCEELCDLSTCSGFMWGKLRASGRPVALGKLEPHLRVWAETRLAGRRAQQDMDVTALPPQGDVLQALATSQSPFLCPPSRPSRGAATPPSPGPPLVCVGIPSAGNTPHFPLKLLPSFSLLRTAVLERCFNPCYTEVGTPFGPMPHTDPRRRGNLRVVRLAEPR